MWARPVSLTAIFPLAVGADPSASAVHPKLALQPPKLDMRRKLAIFKLNLHSSCHSEDRSGISNCSRSAWTQHVMKAGRIDLDLRKDRLTIGRNLTSDRSESFVGPTSV